MTKAEGRVLGYIELRAENGVARLSIGGIARALGIHKRTAQRALRELEKEKAIRIRRGDGRKAKSEISVLEREYQNGDILSIRENVPGGEEKTSQAAMKSMTWQRVTFAPPSSTRKGDMSPFNPFASASPKHSPASTQLMLPELRRWTPQQVQAREISGESVGYELTPDWETERWLRQEMREVARRKKGEEKAPIAENLPLFDGNVVRFRKPA